MLVILRSTNKRFMTRLERMKRVLILNKMMKAKLRKTENGKETEPECHSTHKGEKSLEPKLPYINILDERNSCGNLIGIVIK